MYVMPCSLPLSHVVTSCLPSGGKWLRHGIDRSSHVMHGQCLVVNDSWMLVLVLVLVLWGSYHARVGLGWVGLGWE